jgi:hypothetical protein
MESQARKRKDPDRSIGGGVLVQTRFERCRYPEIAEAAAQEGLAISAFVRTTVYRAITAAKRNRRKYAAA